MVLPCIHDQFTTYVREIVAAKGFQETHVTSRRILSELIANFKHHIAFSCKVQKYRILVYRRNANLIPFLSEVMWKLWNTTSTQNESSGNKIITEKNSNKESRTIDNCFNHLNNLIHTQINYGWTVNDDKLSVVWDTPANLEAIRGRVNLLLSGCKCVTGCSTGRCGCKRSNKNAQDANANIVQI